MIIGTKVRLRPKRLGDARQDYSWQTDPELVQLDAAPLLNMTFPQYLSDYAAELLYSFPIRHRFAVDTLDGKHIGNCGYYNIDEAKGEAELGIMIGCRDYWDRGYGADTVAALVDYIFTKTKLRRIYLKTLDSNHRAQRCFEKCHFTPYSRLVRNGFSFVFMELSRKQWPEKQVEA
ncbi:MAG: N-acetyltransferase [Dehalococcoidia bacterium]|nr:MAG: N-acetyltransferase [Dehalococcoidia bacterium]